MGYDTIIFDLDGTLLNTLEDLADSLNWTLRQFGLPTKSLEEVKSFVGNGVKNLIQLSVPNDMPDEKRAYCLEVFRAHYSKNLQNKTGPYDGIMELLRSLKKKNVKMAVVSNKYDQAVKALCGSFFSEYISVAIGESDSVRKKPAPDSVFEALRQLGSMKENALYAGDSETDVRTAGNAGLKFVGVLWGFRSREILESEGADLLIQSPLELLKLISLLNGA